MINRISINGNNIECSNLGDIEISYSQSSDPACFQVVVEMSTKLVFVGDAFDQIVQMTSDLCTKNKVELYQMCDLVEVNIFSGFFTLTNCEFDYDRCTARVELEPNNAYNCLTKSWEDDFNILQTPIDPLTSGIIEYQFFNNLEYTISLAAVPVTGYGFIGEWRQDTNTPPEPELIMGAFARVIEVTGCLGGVPQAPDSDPSWYLVSDDCADTGTAKWARPAIVGGANPDVGQISYNWNSGQTSYAAGNTGVPSPPPATMVNPVFFGFYFLPAFTQGLPSGTYTFYAELTDLFGSNPISVDNGRNLNDVIQYLLDQQSCGLTFKSTFYGTTGFENDPNPVTGLIDNPMSGLVMFQKSDVADPSATENATIANVSLSTLVQDLNAMHNVWWQIDEITNEFIIEHWSTLNVIPTGIDLTTAPYLEYAKNNNTVSFNKAEQPSKEEFAYAVDSNDVDFNGLNITYQSDCAGTSSIKRQTQQICTDWAQVFNNPEFETEGLMLVQPESLDPSGSKAQNGRITGVFNPNAPLGYGATLPDYYTYNRPSKEGTINNTLTVFDSTSRIKSIKQVTIPFCCAIDDPNVLINTSQGLGIIEEGTYSPSKQIITLKTILEL